MSASMKKKPVLGKGLSALMNAPAHHAKPAAHPHPSPAVPSHVPAVDAEFARIPVGEIRASPFQPRKTFSPEEMHEMVESVKEKGVLQPLLVRRVAQGFELIAGERRLRGAQAAGIPTVPARIVKMSDREAMEAGIVENVQRADLNPVELAEGYQRLAHEFGMSQEDIAKRVGKERATVANAIRLLRLPDAVKVAIIDGVVSAGHARALLSLPPERVAAVFAVVVRKGLSVRETEGLCQGGGAKTKPKKEKRAVDADVVDLEERLSRRGGTKVRLKGTSAKGVIEVHFDSAAELDRLVEALFPGR